MHSSWWPNLARYRLGDPCNCAGSSGGERDDQGCPSVSTTSATTVYHAQVQCYREHEEGGHKIQGYFSKSWISGRLARKRWQDPLSAACLGGSRGVRLWQSRG
jgi:hypothetical protein